MGARWWSRCRRYCARLVRSTCWSAATDPTTPALPTPSLIWARSGLASVVARVADATTLVLVPVDMPLLSVALLGRLLAPSQHRCVAFEDQMLPMCLCIDTGVREALTALMAGPASSRFAARLAACTAVPSRGCHRQRTWRVRQLQHARAME